MNRRRLPRRVIYSVSEEKDSSSKSPLGVPSSEPRVQPQGKTTKQIFEELERANSPNYARDLADSLKVDMPKAPKVDPESLSDFKFPAYGYLGISIITAILAFGSVTEILGGKPLVSQATSGQ